MPLRSGVSLWGAVGLRVLSGSFCRPLQHVLVVKTSAPWTPEVADFSKSFKQLAAGLSCKGCKGAAVMQKDLFSSF